MDKRTIDMKPAIRNRLKQEGLTDPMIDDMAKSIDDGHANATTRIDEIDAQIAQLTNDRAFWLEKQAGYAGALDKVVDVKIEVEEPVVEEPAAEVVTLDAADVGEVKLK